MRRLVLFDVDGTLVDVAGAGRAALESAMTRVYGETGPIDTFDFHGKTDPAIVRELLGAVGRGDGWIEERMPRVWSHYLDALAAELEERRSRVRTYPGVVELLDRLGDDERFRLGLVTGNVRGGAVQKLTACGLAGRFSVGAFGSDSPRREELPPLAMERAARREKRDYRPDEVWVVGDTPHDIRCGRHSRLRTLAVATGRHDRAELERHGADAAVDTLDDADRLVRTLAS